ncbi:conserved hypothetical protein [Candidatus Protochlamydia naegleriophila]|uniref:DUF302 domain-containing protein n=1 Tax=Candidatus Protochlamydia naegleriophila TaxID=389348 RepID=A0A0U5JDM5_9BACT|nr:DUF302 domain-containing protein [Candidatus Protochlamydia naegleriophila]CUI16906.1 conserved hypothetical protein [Candidatus Protochlamydia naegleriophila]
MAQSTSLQLIVRQSPHSVPMAVERLENGILARGMKMFAKIDHAREAQDADMSLNAEIVLIFGDPKVGTFLMQENPLIGLELPLRLLVWQNENNTNIAYVDPISLGSAYEIYSQAASLKKISGALAALVEEAIK